MSKKVFPTLLSWCPARARVGGSRRLTWSRLKCRLQPPFCILFLRAGAGSVALTWEAGNLQHLRTFRRMERSSFKKKGAFREVEESKMVHIITCYFFWWLPPSRLSPSCSGNFQVDHQPVYQTIKHKAVCLSLHLHHTAGPQASRCLSSECLVKVKCHSMLLAQDQDRWFWEI